MFSTTGKNKEYTDKTVKLAQGSMDESKDPFPRVSLVREKLEKVPSEMSSAFFRACGVNFTQPIKSSLTLLRSVF